MFTPLPSRTRVAREGVSDDQVKLYGMHIPTPTASRKRQGLSALLGAPVELESLSAESVSGLNPALDMLEVKAVHRNTAQPRTSFDKDTISKLAASIEENGVIQPIAVCKTAKNTYKIIAGERRWLAAQQAGLLRIPAVIHNVDERETLVLGLVENLVREDLSPIETARAYAVLQDEFSMTTSEIARSVTKSRSAVANTMRLLELPDTIINLLTTHQITEGHGRALLGCKDRLQAQKLASLTVNQNLTVRQLEAKVRDLQQGSTHTLTKKTKWNIDPSPELVSRVEVLCERMVGVRPQIKLGSTGAKLEFHCEHTAQLLELIELLETQMDQQSVTSAA